MRKRLLTITRKILEHKASLRVLVIGDSHVRVFENWRFLLAFPKIHFNIVYVPGGTALGICNPTSITRARQHFDEALSDKAHDLVLVCLGEVDTAYAIWKKAETSKQAVQPILATAIERYCAFLSTLKSQGHSLVVLSAPLPTLPDQTTATDSSVRIRGTIQASKKKRTEMTIEFNRKTMIFCDQHNIPFLSTDGDALGVDGLVREDWLNKKKIDHHYARAPYARSLIARLDDFLGRARAKD